MQAPDVCSSDKALWGCVGLLRKVEMQVPFSNSCCIEFEAQVGQSFKAQGSGLFVKGPKGGLWPTRKIRGTYEACVEAIL